MFEMTNGMAEMTQTEAQQVVGGALIIVVCLAKAEEARCMWSAEKVSMQDFHFVM